MICELIEPVPGAFESPMLEIGSPECAVYAYVCDRCQLTHLSISITGDVKTCVNLTEDQALKLSQMIANPPTLEALEAAMR